MATPTIESPVVERGTFEGKGKDTRWKPSASGNIISIIYGEGEKRNGEHYRKNISFGKEKAQAILNAISEIEEFVNS